MAKEFFLLDEATRGDKVDGRRPINTRRRGQLRLVTSLGTLLHWPLARWPWASSKPGWGRPDTAQLGHAQSNIEMNF
jgi:hypothetical protein